MMYFIYFILASIGLTTLVVRSKIMKPTRELITLIATKVNFKVKRSKYKTVRIISVAPNLLLSVIKWVIKKIDNIINCETCCGFWAGMAIYVCVYVDLSYFIVIFGLISLAVNHIVFNLLDALIKHLKR